MSIEIHEPLYCVNRALGDIQSHWRNLNHVSQLAAKVANIALMIFLMPAFLLTDLIREAALLINRGVQWVRAKCTAASPLELVLQNNCSYSPLALPIFSRLYLKDAIRNALRFSDPDHRETYKDLIAHTEEPHQHHSNPLLDIHQWGAGCLLVHTLVSPADHLYPGNTHNSTELRAAYMDLREKERGTALLSIVAPGTTFPLSPRAMDLVNDIQGQAADLVHDRHFLDLWNSLRNENI